LSACEQAGSCRPDYDCRNVEQQMSRGCGPSGEGQTSGGDGDRDDRRDGEQDDGGEDRDPYWPDNEDDGDREQDDGDRGENQEGSAPVGSACRTASDCRTETCLQYPGGYCSAICETTQEDPCPSGSGCVPLHEAGSVGVCAERCQDDSDCRQSEGYRCGGWRGSAQSYCHSGRDREG
jgi:hypothetical protein